MKRFTHFILMLMVATSPLMMTSCDSDYWYDDSGYWYDRPWYGDHTPWWYGYSNGYYNWNNGYYNNGGNYNGGGQQGNTLLDEAQVLSGKWTGQMQFTNGTTGEQASFDVAMTFVQANTNAIKGTGVEIDVSGNERQTLEFTWYIDYNGNIYIKYASGSTYVMDISASTYGFRLEESTGIFRGYMAGTNNKDMIYIDLTRTESAKSSTRASSIRNFGNTDLQKQEIKGEKKLIRR